MPRVPRPFTGSCPFCLKASFPNQGGLNRHIRSHKPETWFWCDWPSCDKGFPQKSALTIHMNTHTRNKPHECPVCKRPFGDPSSLSRHLRSVHKKGPGDFVCSECGHDYTRYQSLCNHLQTRHGIFEKPPKVPRKRGTQLAEARLRMQEREQEQQAQQEQLGRAGPSRSKPSRAARKSKAAPYAHEAPQPLEYQSLMKPEPQDERYLGIDFGTPYQPHHYAQDLPPLPVPAYRGVNTDTPRYVPQDLATIIIPPSPRNIAYGGEMPANPPWTAAPRYLPSPGSSARQSPLVSPNMVPCQIQPLPVHGSLQVQTYDQPPYQKPTYEYPGQSMLLGGAQYPGTPVGGYLPDLEPAPAPAHDSWDSYFNNPYGA
ncbi:hypothetical protein PENSPDRAFT_632490 [Peniophora sp. CONT]|nr:hypothetical protein PENSPDRAFT_632490 [Peniophora sp. CONT]